MKRTEVDNLAIEEYLKTAFPGRKKVIRMINDNFRKEDTMACNCCHGIYLKRSKTLKEYDENGEFYLEQNGAVINYHIDIYKLLRHQTEFLAPDFHTDEWLKKNPVEEEKILIVTQV